MPGLGRKAFAAGDVLTAADLQGYAVDQSIMVFGGTAARGSAISSPSEGMFTYLSDSNTLQYYNGTAWVDSYSATNGAAVTNRNLIYNGAMQVAQRGTSTASITAGGYYTADRWQTIIGTQGTWTQSVENDAPTGSGFRKSLKMLCTTADAAPAAGDQLWIRQMLEGQDVQRVKNGTSAAESLTVSFWVKSNVTGTFIVGLWNEDDANRRIVSAAYTITSSGTWEKKTVTFAGDTTGAAFDNDNADSLELHFWLGAGSNYTSGTLATTWANRVDASRAVGQTNLAAATNNYWQVTGVQLEIGPVATSFEFKSYGQELRECQRYYQKHGGYLPGFFRNTTQTLHSLRHNVTMRTAPTITSDTGFYVNSNNDPLVSSLWVAGTVGESNISSVGYTLGSSGSAGYGCYANLGTGYSIYCNSEL